MAVFEVPPHAVSRQRVRVRFGETDLMGIVHHAQYLLYFEAGRVEYLRRRGVRYGVWATRGLHLPVIAAELRYKRTARFDDVLIVESRLGELGRVKLRFDYRLLRELADGGEELVTEGSTTLACVGDDHAPKRIPLDVVDVVRGPEIQPRDERAV
jgi:acyl-CoA thioester hydrolase